MVRALSVVCLAVVGAAAALDTEPVPSGWLLATGAIGLVGYMWGSIVEWFVRSTGDGLTPIEPSLLVMLAVLSPAQAALAATVGGVVFETLWHRELPNYRVVYSMSMWGLCVLVAGTLAEGYTGPVPWLVGPVIAALVLLAVPSRLIALAKWLAGYNLHLHDWPWLLAVIAAVCGAFTSRLADTDPLAAAAAATVTVASIPLQQRVAVNSLRAWHAEREQRRFAQLVVRAEDLARSDMAEAVHAGPLQTLAAAGVSIDPTAMTPQDAAEARAFLDAALRDLRALVSGYTSGVVEVDHLGWSQALHHQLAPIPDDVTVTVTEPDGWADLTRPVRVQAYRIALEAATNALKYASASLVTVTATLDQGTLTVTVTDDGSGFDPGEVSERRDRPHLGLALMRARTEGLGGRFELLARPGAGTTITAALPVVEASALLDGSGLVDGSVPGSIGPGKLRHAR